MALDPAHFCKLYTEHTNFSPFAPTATNTKRLLLETLVLFDPLEKTSVMRAAIFCRLCTLITHKHTAYLMA